jgi:hypothetical protein
MPAIATKKKSEGIDLNAILSGAAVTKDSKSKSIVPEISVSQETRELATTVRGLKEELDSIKSMFELKEQELITAITPEREKYCLSHGYISSIKIADTNKLYCSLSWKDAYTKIDIANQEAIQEIVGAERYPQFFETKMEITVKDISEASLTELIQLVGPEKFARFFAVERNIKPTSRYTTEFFTAFRADQRFQLSPYIKQYKPALRVK